MTEHKNFYLLQENFEQNFVIEIISIIHDVRVLVSVSLAIPYTV